MTLFEYQAWVTKVVDGDTIHIKWDFGRDLSILETLRFYGVNAPEMSTEEGRVCRAWVQGWFAQHCPDQRFILRTIKDRREKYGRYLAMIYSPDRVHCLNEELVAAGMAVPYFP